MIRRALKTAVERLLGDRIATRRIRRHDGGDFLVLAFHNVVPDDAPQVGDRSLHLRLSDFNALIDRLLESCTPVSLSGPVSSDRRPRFAVTFDDAYRGAVTLALPALRARNVPATVFVPTALIGDREFWWDAVADPVLGLTPGIRHHALERLRGDDALIRAWAQQQGWIAGKLGAEWRSSTIEELRTAVRRPGVELAAHTATHRALDLLDDTELREELGSPLAWFDEHELPYRRILTYPYGRWSDRARLMAEELGYESAWLVSGGWRDRTTTDRLLGPRLNIPAGTSIRGMMMRIAGLVRS